VDEADYSFCTCPKTVKQEDTVLVLDVPHHKHQIVQTFPIYDINNSSSNNNHINNNNSIDSGIEISQNLPGPLDEFVKAARTIVPGCASTSKISELTAVVIDDVYHLTDVSLQQVAADTSSSTVLNICDALMSPQAQVDNLYPAVFDELGAVGGVGTSEPAAQTLFDDRPSPSAPPQTPDPLDSFAPPAFSSLTLGSPGQSVVQRTMRFSHGSRACQWSWRRDVSREDDDITKATKTPRMKRQLSRRKVRWSDEDRLPSYSEIDLYPLKSPLPKHPRP
jgi:hypothetical protein